MTRLDTPDASWAGLAAVYSIIHLPRADRERAYAEMARVLRPGAWILIAFHVDSATARPGDSIHLDEFLGHRVDLDGYFLAPDEVAAGLTAAGIRLEARFDREPWPDLEYPSRRSYLLWCNLERAKAGAVLGHPRRRGDVGRARRQLGVDRVTDPGPRRRPQLNRPTRLEGVMVDTRR